MTYRDLPSNELIQKLMATSFDSPSTNKKVFDWCSVVLPLVRFRENERIKLIEKHGEKTETGMGVMPSKLNDFFKDFDRVLDMEVEQLPEFPISLESFEDEKCFYPKDKELWISPKEIEILFKVKEKQGD